MPQKKSINSAERAEDFSDSESGLERTRRSGGGTTPTTMDRGIVLVGGGRRGPHLPQAVWTPGSACPRAPPGSPLGSRATWCFCGSIRTAGNVRGRRQGPGGGGGGTVESHRGAAPKSVWPE